MLPMQVKGITAHFHRSTKGMQAMFDIQADMGLKEVKPPIASDSRWGGYIPMLIWTSENLSALKRYASDCPRDCALNDDGTGFKDHVLSAEEYEYLPQLVSLELCNVDSTCLMYLTCCVPFAGWGL